MNSKSKNGIRKMNRIKNQNEKIDTYGIRIMIYLGLRGNAKNLNEIMKFDAWKHNNPDPWQRSLTHLKELSIVMSQGTKNIKLTPDHPVEYIIPVVAEPCLKRRIWEDVKKLTVNEYLAIGIYLATKENQEEHPDLSIAENFNPLVKDMVKNQNLEMQKEIQELKNKLGGLK